MKTGTKKIDFEISKTQNFTFTLLKPFLTRMHARTWPIPYSDPKTHQKTWNALIQASRIYHPLKCRHRHRFFIRVKLLLVIKWFVNEHERGKANKPGFRKASPLTSILHAHITYYHWENDAMQSSLLGAMQSSFSYPDSDLVYKELKSRPLEKL